MRDETDTELRVVIPQPRTAPCVAYGCDWCGQGDHDPIKPQDGELCGSWTDGVITTSISEHIATGEVNCPYCHESNEEGSACKRCAR
ncbi:hypothetical protein ACWC5C_38805 [Streptomyces sp. NPDC001700]